MNSASYFFHIEKQKIVEQFFKNTNFCKIWQCFFFKKNQKFSKILCTSSINKIAFWDLARVS